MANCSERASRLAVAGVAVSMLLASGPRPAAASAVAPASTSISGRIFSKDAATPVSGAVVKAFNRASEETFVSVPTGTDGGYSLEGLTPGEYDLGIGTEAGIYLAGASVPVAAGQKRAVSFALRPEEAEGTGGQVGAETPPDDPNAPQKQPPPTKKQRKLASSKWTRGLATTGIVLGGAIVVGAIASNGNDGNGSPN